METDGPQHEGAFAYGGQQLVKDPIPFSRILFEKLAVFLTEPVGFQLFGDQFRDFGGEKLAFENAFFFRLDGSFFPNELILLIELIQQMEQNGSSV